MDKGAIEYHQVSLIVKQKHTESFQIQIVGQNMIQHTRNAVEKKKRIGNLKKYQNNRLLVLQPQMQFHRVKIFLLQSENKAHKIHKRNSNSKKLIPKPFLHLHHHKHKSNNKKVMLKLFLLLYNLKKNSNLKHNRNHKHNSNLKHNSNHKQLQYQNLKLELFLLHMLT